MSAFRLLLIPSGQLWSEQYVDDWPPEFVRYWGCRWRIEHRSTFFRRRSTQDASVGEDLHDVYLMLPDRGTRLGRLWWRRIVKRWALWRRDYRLLSRCDDYPFGGAQLAWRCEITPERHPWHTGDQQPRFCRGVWYWPVSIAVFDPGPDDDTVDKHERTQTTTGRAITERS